MANDSTHADNTASAQDMAATNDAYFTNSFNDDDAFFGPEQLAQANPGTPVVVPVPQDQNVIRVQVTPGEILELSAPFDPGAALLGREADGNLAIRVGDVTVILVGYVEANATAPVVVETSDGKPLDIATLLASTDPAIDIQTAAGPGDTGGQGADNTGAILAQLQGGNGLTGLNAVGAQDGTSLTYGLIDNSIKLDRADDLLALTTTTGTAFKGLAEPFLRDPFNNDPFNDFTSFYTNYGTDVDGTGNAWADFTGTAANGTSFESYLEQTSFSNVVTHSSLTDEPIYIDCTALALQLAGMQSNQHDLYIDPLTVGMDGHATTVFVRREGDDALVLVIHAHEAGNGLSDDTTASSGDYQIDTYLINRLDHPDQGQDILNLDIPYDIRQLNVEEVPTFVSGTVQTPIQDDIPIVGETTYYNFLHACSFEDAADCFSAFLGGKITDVLKTTDAGHVDEDFIFGGNRDKDNALGPDSDAARGDDIGDKFVVGKLDINFGADGPSGKIPQGDLPSATDPLFHDANPPALAIAGFQVGSVYPDATSHGQQLMVLKHEMLPFPFSTVEMVQVGYSLTEIPSGSAALLGEGSSDVVVFTLLLQTGPNLPLFGGFVFEQCEPLDHPVGATLETDLPLNFQVIATDDDGDHPVDPVTISILVNDDAPYFSISYTNEDPKNGDWGDDVRIDSLTFGSGYVDHYTTKDFGHVDEDWLNGGISNDGIILANGPGNHDQDGSYHDNANLYGDDKGGLEVCGQIHVKYGADGPSDAANNGELALKTYDTSNGNLPAFVNGDGTTLTSDGKPLVVFISTEGHLQVGVAPFIVPPHDGVPVTLVPGQIVFDLTLNPSTGKFDFQLMGAIDHLPSTVDGNPESNLVLSFDVGSAEDFDHDTALGAINIKVNDDKPEVGITYYNELPYSDDGSSGVNYKYDTDKGRIDEDWLRGGELSLLAGGSYLGNMDKDADGTSNANANGDDDGSSHLSGQINMKYGADGPGQQTIALETLSGAFKDADGNALSSAGHPLVVLSSDGHSLEVGYGDTTVFILTLTDSGHFDFTQLEPLDHPVHSTVEDNINLAFNAGSISDGDGDTVAAVIKIQVNDDVPETDVSYVSALNDGTPCDTFDAGHVDEDFLANGNHDQDNANPLLDEDAARGDDFGKTIVTGSIGGTHFGADGPGTPAGTPPSFTLSGAFLDANGNAVKSHGHDLVVLDTSDPTHLVVGYDDGGPVPVFTVTMTSETDFTFELLKPLDHVSEAGDTAENDPSTDVVLKIGAVDGATDGDRDPATAWITIVVDDDAPKSATVSYTSFQSTEEEAPVITSNAYGQVDEDYPGSPTANTDNDNDPFGHQDADRGDTYGTTSCNGTVTAVFGADGPADSPYSLEALGAGTPVFDNASNPLTSHGEPLQVLTCSATGMTVGYLTGSPAVSHLVYEVTLDQVTGFFTFTLYDSLDHPTQDPKQPVENNLLMGFNVIATDYDGDTLSAKVNIQVNDDAPLAVDDADPNSTYAGNVITGPSFDYLGADGAAVSRVTSTTGDDETVTKDTSSVIVGALGMLTMSADGTWTYQPNAGTSGGIDVFTYTLTDGDGDTSTAKLTITVLEDESSSRLAAVNSVYDESAYALHLQVTSDTDATTQTNYHVGDNVKIDDTSKGFFGIGAGHTLKGGSGDDLIFGNDGSDHIYGRAGHDAQSGGSGNDEFHNVDAADLDGTHTLDGTHSIDGGDGIDTVDLGGLATFDSSQAARIENVEVLNFKGDPTGATGTQVTLSYDAAYGVTQVGGLHVLGIAADAGKDTVHLVASSGKSWESDGEFFGAQVFHAGSGGDKVTVTVDHGVSVDLS